MIGGIRCAQTREFAVMPKLKVPPINDHTANLQGMSIHIFCRAEWMTMSAPPRKRTDTGSGVAKVLSTNTAEYHGHVRHWQTFSMSSTFMAGFAMISPNTAFVFGRKAAFRFPLAAASGSTKVHFDAELLRKVMAQQIHRTAVNRRGSNHMVSAFQHIHQSKEGSGLCPDLLYKVHRHRPPVRRSFFSTASTVGLEIREYMCPSCCQIKQLSDKVSRVIFIGRTLVNRQIHVVPRSLVHTLHAEHFDSIFITTLPPPFTAFNFTIISMNIIQSVMKNFQNSYTEISL